MNINPFRQARFISGSPDARHLPADTGLEVAFAGRSNVGKSSLINVLTDNRKLARISKTPGRTREINFFEVAPGVRLVDLPGYGYARVERQLRAQWGHLMSAYLSGRASLAGLVVIMDARHPLLEADMQMLEVLSATGLQAHFVLNKADKLGASGVRSVRTQVIDQLSNAAGAAVSVQMFSARTGMGLEELMGTLELWLWPVASGPGA